MSVSRTRPLRAAGPIIYRGCVSHKGMTLVPAGVFRMGSAAFYPEEGPVATIEVDSLWVDDHPAPTPHSAGSSPTRDT
jgi:formylglycine-generating enzyme required for sulfatase activity